MSDVDVLKSLGIDLDEIEWRDLALCATSGMDTELFYDKYEGNENVARDVDQACLSCPVLKQCLEYGTTNGEYGVWGGIFLTSGKPDDNKNSHKTPEIWEEIRNRISESTN